MTKKSEAAERRAEREKVAAEWLAVQVAKAPPMTAERWAEIEPIFRASIERRLREEKARADWIAKTVAKWPPMTDERWAKVEPLFREIAALCE